MLKLILKRFLIAVGICVFCVVLMYICAYLYIVVTASFPVMKPVMKALTYILCVIGPLCFVLFLKVDNTHFLGRYSEHLLETEKSFKNDCLFVLKSKEHLATLIVVNCIFVTMEISVALSNKIPALPLIIGTLLLIVAQTAFFSVLDCLLWMLAFYLKGKRKKKTSPVGEV